MLSSITSYSSPQEVVVAVFAFLMIMLVSLPLHECAHGWTALLLGDDTAEKCGRLNLNPIAHLDPMGAIAMLLFGIGWAKPVPINSSKCNKYKHIKPKAAMAITAAAGPLSNILLGYIFLIITRCVLNSSYSLLMSGKESAALYIYYAMYMVAYTNVYLAVFNLLPIPPFDGSRIFLVFLPQKLYFKVMKYERIIMIVIMLLLFFGVFSIPFGFLTNAIMGLLDRGTEFVNFIVKVN